VSGTSVITDTYSHASAGGSSDVGGLIGYVSGGSVFRSYSTGAVTGTSNAGGFLGTLGFGSVSHCYWDTETSGQEASAGGEGRTTGQMTYPHDAETTYVEWDFVETWAGDAGHWRNHGYPYLRGLAELDYGDVNGDGSIDVADAILVLRHIVGLIDIKAEFGSDAIVRGKVSGGDGNLDVGDSILILRYIVGLITKFPVEG
jgi:hypothetical protein